MPSPVEVSKKGVQMKIVKETKHYILFDKPIKTGLISDVFFDEDLERIFGKRKTND